MIQQIWTWESLVDEYLAHVDDETARQKLADWALSDMPMVVLHMQQIARHRNELMQQMDQMGREANAMMARIDDLAHSLWESVAPLADSIVREAAGVYWVLDRTGMARQMTRVETWLYRYLRVVPRP